MIFQLYRIRHQNRIGYAILDHGQFYFVDVSRPDMPIDPSKSVPATECKLLSPTTPTKIVAVGLNYRDHAEERGKPIPSEPLLFLKPPSSLLPPGEPIVLPAASQRVDPEGELAVVIGKLSRKLASQDEARAAIFGYACFNDVTARDLQDKDVQFTRAKGFDTFSPYGPCIAIGVDPSDLAITTRVNGQVRQHSRTSQLIFSAEYLVWYVSHVMTLMPGDVISTGTPSGIAPISSGDIVEIELESVGVLQNPVL